MSRKCYCCDVEIDSSNDHFEHVIPQGIGGKLQSDGILCISCGEELGKKIDSNFCENFSEFQNLMDVKKDRGKSLNPHLYDVDLEGLKIIAALQDRELVPNRYVFDEKSNTVYSHPKIAKNLAKKFPEAEFVTNLDPTIVNFRPELNLNSTHLGLSKIATEYALTCGVDISSMEKVFDNSNKKFITEGNIIPYFPINYFESFIESIRWFTEPEFPTHSLKLFSVSNYLFCYIDLFSVYQFYVFISDNYNGEELSCWHIESVNKLTPIHKEYDLSFGDPKDIHIASQDLGIEIDELYRQIHLGKTLFKQDTVPPYKKEDPNSYFTNVTMNILQQYLLYLGCMNTNNKSSILKLIPTEIQDRLDCFCNVSEEKKMQFMLDIKFLAYPVDGHDYFDMKRYKSFIRKDGLIGITPLQIMNNIESLRNKIKEYQGVRYNHLIGLSKIWD